MLPRDTATRILGDTRLLRAITPGAAAALAFALCLLILLIGYWSTFSSMTAVWLRSGTHAHGLIVAPIALWLVWRERAALRACTIRPYRWALCGLLALGLVWMLSSAAFALVTEQLAVVAMIPVMLLALTGFKVLRALRFPCAYLIFLVPFGEPLIAPLSELTATVTVSLLRFSGIDVFREGLYFSTKVGDFEVARSCSGIRYLTASLAVGTLFAHLTFSTLRNKLRFAALCVIVPIVANGLRAYLIVVLAHVSNMALAVDVDHIVYGWVFFGLVMMALFWVGRLMQKRESVAAPTRAAAEQGGAVASASVGELTLMCGATAIALLAAPFLAGRLQARATNLGLAAPQLPQIVGDWSGPHATPGYWSPEFHGAHQQLIGTYRRTGSSAVDLAVVSYDRQSEDAELIGHENRLADAARWRVLASSESTVTLADGLKLPVVETIAESNSRGARRVIWSLYRIGGRRTTSSYIGKALQAFNSLIDPGAGAALVAFSAEDIDAPTARQVLQQFVSEHYGATEGCVDGGRAPHASCTVPRQETERGDQP